MNGNGTSEGMRVELYARQSLPDIAANRRDQVAGRLKQLADNGHVSEVTIHNWDKKVHVDAECREMDLYEEFLAWATEVGVGLEPFFDTRNCYSMETGEKGDQLVFPALCVAVYRDDTLQSVYPHSTNDGSRSVMDCLRTIESARRQVPSEFDDDGSPASDEAVRQAPN